MEEPFLLFLKKLTQSLLNAHFYKEQ